MKILKAPKKKQSEVQKITRALRKPSTERKIVYAGFLEHSVYGSSVTQMPIKRDPVPMIQSYAREHKKEFQFWCILDDIIPRVRANAILPEGIPADYIKRSALVAMWNSSRHYAQPVSKICSKRGIPKFYIEQGMLPQKDNFFIDPLGFYGDSILSKDLSWVNAQDVDAMFSARDELQQKYEINPQGYVLVPLQIENDSSVLYHSHYNDMSELLEYVEYMYPNKTIIAKAHPLGDQYLFEYLPKRFKKITFNAKDDLFELAAKADLVVGITSTCLFECAILGVPVVALGDHPLRMNKKEDFDKVLAGALALNISRHDDDALRPILERFGIKPL
jgi:hypothetical protein